MTSKAQKSTRMVSVTVCENEDCEPQDVDHAIDAVKLHAFDGENDACANIGLYMVSHGYIVTMVACYPKGETKHVWWGQGDKQIQLAIGKLEFQVWLD
jgi:hypothetical protein